MPRGENKLTDQELQWMEDLLAECHREGTLPRHRFELASFAIIGKGNTKKAFARLKNLRRVEAEYRVDEIESAMAHGVCEAASPGMSRPGGRDSLGRPSVYNDYAKTKPNNFKSELEFRCLTKATLQYFEALTTTIEEVREGCVMLCRGKDMGWENFSFSFEKRQTDIGQDAFPLKLKAIYAIDPPFFASAAIKIMRLFMKKKIADRLILCSAEQVLSGEVGKFSPEQLPLALGGTYSESEEAWLERCLKIRDASIQELGPL